MSDQAAIVLPDDEDFAVLKVAEVATLMRCSTWTVYERINKGELRSVHVGRSIRVPRAAVAEFYANGGSGTH